jgi:hypothetical protein
VKYRNIDLKRKIQKVFGKRKETNGGRGGEDRIIVVNMIKVPYILV